MAKTSEFTELEYDMSSSPFERRESIPSSEQSEDDELEAQLYESAISGSISAALKGQTRENVVTPDGAMLFGMVPLEQPESADRSAAKPRDGGAESVDSLAAILAKGEPEAGQLKRLTKAMDEAHAKGELLDLVNAINAKLTDQGSAYRIGKIHGTVEDYNYSDDPSYRRNVTPDMDYKFELLQGTHKVCDVAFKSENCLRADPEGLKNRHVRESYSGRSEILEALAVSKQGKVSDSYIRHVFEDGCSDEKIEQVNKSLSERGAEALVSEVFAEPTDKEGEWNYVVKMSNGERIIYRTAKTNMPNADGKFSKPRQR